MTQALLYLLIGVGFAMLLLGSLMRSRADRSTAEGAQRFKVWTVVMIVAFAAAAVGLALRFAGGG